MESTSSSSEDTCIPEGEVCQNEFPNKETDINLGCFDETDNGSTSIEVGDTICGKSSSTAIPPNGDYDTYLLKHDGPHTSEDLSEDDGGIVSIELSTNFPYFFFGVRDLSDFPDCVLSDDAPADVTFSIGFDDPLTFEGPFERKRSYKLAAGDYEIVIQLVGEGNEYACDGGVEAEYTLSVLKGGIPGVNVTEGIPSNSEFIVVTNEEP